MSIDSLSRSNQSQEKVVQLPISEEKGVSEDNKWEEEIKNTEEDINQEIPPSSNDDSTIESEQEVTIGNNTLNDPEYVPDDDSRYFSEDDDDQNDGIRSSGRTNKGIPPERFAHSSNIAIQEQREPRNFHEAQSSAGSAFWKKAMDEEMRSLKANETWELQELPDGRRAIGCKWLYKIKTNSEDNTPRYKARLVAQGFTQKYVSEYDEVFAPVVRQTTLRVFLTVAGEKHLIVRHYDAKTAFLNGELQEEIYMKQLLGYASENSQLVCRLKRNLYGLKQAARVWNRKLDSILNELGFKSSVTDACLYTWTYPSGCTYLIVYVDDILIASKQNEEIHKVSSTLQKHFKLTDLGEISHYLGMAVKRGNDGFFQISQQKYVEKILEFTKLQDAKESKIPMDPGYLKLRDDAPVVLEDGTLYHKLIGALLYLAVHTRPDISTRKSNSGYLFFYRGAAISWSCKKQTCVSLSSTEAEYVALTEACREGLWLRKLVSDFGDPQQKPTIIYEDNQSCIKLIDSEKFNPRTKHIHTRFHFVKQLKETREMFFENCPTEHMTADMMTKPLNAQKHKRHVSGVGLGIWKTHGHH